MAMVAACKRHGILFCPHDNYIDFYPRAIQTVGEDEGGGSRAIRRPGFIRANAPTR
jgi:hypothetical protein